MGAASLRVAAQVNDLVGAIHAQFQVAIAQLYGWPAIRRRDREIPGQRLQRCLDERGRNAHNLALNIHRSAGSVKHLEYALIGKLDAYFLKDGQAGFVDAIHFGVRDDFEQLRLLAHNFVY